MSCLRAYVKGAHFRYSAYCNIAVVRAVVRAMEEVKEVIKAKDNILEAAGNNLVKSHCTEDTAMVDLPLASLADTQEYTVVLLPEFDSHDDHASPSPCLFARRPSL